jgi:Coenzyme F420-dependent N5,N10-methylene tetrahydromethanopterin reductase and related flavin-dependent oxidoreductases
MRPNRTSVQFDMRAPDFGTPAATLYPAALEMAEFADAAGIDRIGLMEHHQSDDGYLPAPFVMGGAVAARTRRIRITLGAVILPLHDPVKIAEQIAVLDLISGGRMEVIFGAGYVPNEFAAFEVSLRDRGKLLDKGIEIIIRALEGERFEKDGRPVFVRPLPIQPVREILMGGGGVAASAKRAGRFGIGYSPLHDGFNDLYYQECEAAGHKPGTVYGSGLPLNVHLSEDPDATWPKVMPHFAHMAQSYAKWAEQEGTATNSPFAGLETAEKMQASGIFVVLTPEQLLARAGEFVQNNRSINFMPLIGGMAPDLGWESLRLAAERVVPHLPKI